MLSRPAVCLLVAALLPSAAGAAIFITPKDVELIDAADVIVIGRVTQMNGEFLAGGDIATMIDIEVETVLKGSVPASKRIRIGELGGFVGSSIMGVSAAPQYWRRNRALIFIEKTSGGMRTWGSALGKFDFVNDRFNRDLLVRWAREEDMSLWSNDGHPVDNRLRDAEGFLSFIREHVQQQQQHAPAPARRRAVTTPPPPGPGPSSDVEECSYCVEDIPREELTPPDYWDVEVDQHGYPASAYTQGTFRWETFDKGGSVTFYVSSSQPGYDSLGAAQRGLAAWTNDPTSNIDYRFGGTRTVGFVEDGTNAIIFNDSSGAVPGGALAYAKWYGGAYHTYKGEQFISIFEGDVIVRSGINVSQKVFDEAVTHELGHTLGFRHSDQGTPSSTQAVMKSVLSGVYGATLGPWDTEAAHAVYGTTTTTNVPGTPSGLVATATSTSSVQLTWNAVPGATAYEVERSDNNRGFARVATVPGTSYLHTSLTANTTYLFRVRALAGTTPSAGYSNVDHATTTIFIDDPLVPGTVVKDEHIIQLRTAINAMRAAVGLAQFTFTNAVGPGIIIRAAHITELRSALTPALNARGLTVAYTSFTTGSPIRAIHIQELRDYVK